MLKWFVAGSALWLAYLVREQFPPFIVGMVIAYLLSHPVHILHSHGRVNRTVAVLLVYTLVAGAFALAVWQGLPVVTDQAASLFQQRQAIVANVVEQVTAFTGWSPDVDALTKIVIDKIQTFVATKPEEILAFSGIVSRSLLFILVAVVSSIYFLLDAGKIGTFALRFVPEDKRGEVIKVAGEINGKFSKYMSGQLVLVAIMSTLAYCVLSFYGVKYALVVALLAGVFELIPVFGPLCALILIATIAGSQLGLEGTVPVMVMLWCARMFQDYIVSPRVIGHAVQLHPLVTFFFVLAGETLAGGLGMLLAVPAAAALKVVLDHFYPPAVTGSNSSAGRGLMAQLLDQAKRLLVEIRKRIKK